jgi:hypothetical protein
VSSNKSTPKEDVPPHSTGSIEGGRCFHVAGTG